MILTAPGDDTLAAARMLIDADRLYTLEELLYFFEKPWKYQTEAELWTHAGRPGPDDQGWDLFLARLERHETTP